MSALFCLTLFLVAQCSYASFSWSNCLAGNDVVVIDTLQVGPDPIVVPGDIHLRINGRTTRDIPSSNLHVAMKRKALFGIEIPIPCILEVGSCTYNNISTLVAKMESEGGISGGIGTDVHTMLSNAGVDSSLLPLPPTTLNVADGVIHLPEPPALLSAFTSGDYHIRATVTEEVSKTQIFCLDIFATVKEACSGLACLIG